MEFLLHHGADPDKLDLAHASILSLAVTSPSSTCVSLLLASGVDVNFHGPFGNTPLHNVMRYDRASLRTIDVSLQAGADPSSKNEYGQTPLLAGVDDNPKEHDKPLFLLDRGADIHIQDIYEYNALCFALLNSCGALLATLLKRGADHTGTLKGRGSFLHLVATHSDMTTIRLLTQARLARRDITELKKDGLTAFDVACNRTDVDAKWREAFWEFLESVNINVEQVREMEDPADLDLSKDVEFMDALEQLGDTKG